MSRPTPRTRLFAGPNGSGKTTVQREIARHFPPDFLGVVVNPDDLEAEIRQHGRVDLGRFGVSASESEVRGAFTSSPFLKANNLADVAAALTCDGRVIDFAGLAMNSYYASVLSDFLRRKLLAASISFTSETVMSERGNVDLDSPGRVLSRSRHQVLASKVRVAGPSRAGIKQAHELMFDALFSGGYAQPAGRRQATQPARESSTGEPARRTPAHVARRLDATAKEAVAPSWGVRHL